MGEPDTEQPEEAPAAEPTSRPPRQIGVVAVVAAVVLLVDQLSKTWALRRLVGDPIDSVGSLRFEVFFNTGTAFSMGSGKGLGPWISVLAIGVVLGLSLGDTSRHRLGAVAAGLIAGGALGNLADRAFRGDRGFLHGAVVDFINLQWWPVFNVADACIVVGAGLLILATLREPAS